MTTSAAIELPQRGLRGHLAGLLSLALASCLAVTTEMLPVGLLPGMGESFRVADSVTGLLVSLYAVMVAVLSVPLALVTARFARKPLLLTTLLGYALSNALVAIAPTFLLLAVGRAVGGITHALFFSLCIGYVPRLVSGAQVGRALAIATGGATAGFIVGVPLSTSLGTALGWRTAFGVLAGLSVMTLLLVAKLLPSVSNDAPTRSAQSHGARGALGTVVASNSLTYLGQFTLYTFVSVLFLAAGVRPSFIGPLLLLCGMCGLAGLAYAASTLDRQPRRTTIAILSVVIVAIVGHRRWLPDAGAGHHCGGRVERRLRWCAVDLPGLRGAHPGGEFGTCRRMGQRQRELRDRGRGGDRGGITAPRRPWRTAVGQRTVDRSWARHQCGCPTGISDAPIAPVAPSTTLFAALPDRASVARGGHTLLLRRRHADALQPLTHRSLTVLRFFTSDGETVADRSVGAGTGVVLDGVTHAAHFRTRGARQEEQIDLLRRLFTEPIVDYAGRFDRIDRATLVPKPALTKTSAQST